jgi:hypothetical protein
VAEERHWREEVLRQVLAESQDTPSMSTRFKSLHEVLLQTLAQVIEVGMPVDQPLMDEIYNMAKRF